MSEFAVKVVSGKVVYTNGGRYEGKNPSSEDKIMLEPINYFTNTFKYPDISKTIVNAFNYWIQAPAEKFEENHKTYKLITNGILIRQDLCSNKLVRVGKPTAHCVYGDARVINSILFSGLAPFWIEDKYLDKTFALWGIEGVRTNKLICSTEQFRDKNICPTEEVYFEWCGYRGTLSTILMEIETLQELYGVNKIQFLNLAKFIRNFITIVDECRHLAADITEDISIGHYSFPIMYAIRNSKEGEDLISSIMGQRTTNESLLKYVVSIIKKSGCFNYCKETLQNLKNKIIEEYEKFPKNPLMEAVFDEYIQIPEDFKDISWKTS